jgi:hypothetical protein
MLYLLDEQTSLLYIYEFGTNNYSLRFKTKYVRNILPYSSENNKLIFENYLKKIL